MTDETKKNVLAVVFFICASAFVLAIVILGTGCATQPDPRDPAILHPAPITYPSPR